VELGDSLQFTDGEGKEKTEEQSSQRESTEYTEKSEEKSGNFVASDRKSPPLETRGGHASKLGVKPSSSFDPWPNNGTQED
jgi:hypothetical protein